MNAVRLGKALAVPLALAMSAPVLVPPAPAYAHETEVTIRAVETGDDAGSADEGSLYGKTGGSATWLAPSVALLGAASAGALAVAVKLGREDGDR